MQQRQDLHHIQRGIILSLAANTPQKFTELQPPRLPNNTFSYHLKKLINAGYVDHTGLNYSLTRKALKLVAASDDQKTHAATPPVITMIYVTNDDGETLLINRNSFPFQGWYGLPAGQVHLGESPKEAAERELLEKTGIHVEGELLPFGVIDFQYREKDTDDLFTQAIAFLYRYHFSGDKSKLKDKVSKWGQLSWSKFGRKYILPEVLTVKDIAEGGEYVQKSVRFIEPAHTPVLSTVKA